MHLSLCTRMVYRIVTVARHRINIGSHSFVNVVYGGAINTIDKLGLSGVGSHPVNLFEVINGGALTHYYISDA